MHWTTIRLKVSGRVNVWGKSSGPTEMGFLGRLRPSVGYWREGRWTPYRNLDFLWQDSMTLISGHC